ncbi:CIC11C00000001025 [Sungouiella intermedia]|uniref:ADP-ribosylation factor GTPase-activating protein n=1 Tax=Sungouiella intermedia TaxID=45354 RepID=A0A1L0BYF0_9ASCO|nr:CIC11C00000001025 [[Candida] intermedia]
MENPTICSLAFPYRLAENSKTQLSTLILTNDDDSCRYSLRIKDGRCNGIDRYYTDSKQPVEGRLNFVSNLSGANPLLLSVAPEFHKLKLQLKVSQTRQDRDNFLIILKTQGDDTDRATLEEYLLLDEYGVRNRDVSKISLAKFILSDAPETVVVNDTFDSKGLSGKQLNVSLWEQSAQGFQQLFTFQLWIEESLSSLTSTPKLTVLPEFKTEVPETSTSTFTLAELRKAYNFNIDDGPEFRSVLNKYEVLMPRLKKTLTSIQDEARIMEASLRRIMSSQSKIIELLDSTIHMQFNPLLRKLRVTKRLARQFNLMFAPIEKNVGMLLKKVLNVSTLLKTLGYFNKVLPSEGELSSKKTFERNSKEYYEWLNKYLSNEKDRPQLKLLLKRKAFELSKLDYLSALNSATNNQYFNQHLENILKFCNLKVENNGVFDFQTYNDTKSSQNLLRDDDKLFLNSLSRFNSEKLQLRQLIESSRTNEELTNLIKNNSLTYVKPDDSGLSHPGDRELPTSDKTAITLDLVFPNSTQSTTNNLEEMGQMSGILYALGGKGKPGWHKEWVVLRDGQLMEFSDWRKGRLPINKPIDIALSNIKATKYEKRQFCFEIVTSQNQKHVFQALDNDERNKWMKSLYNAGQVTLKLINKSNTHPKKLKTLHKPLTPQVLSPTELDRPGSPVSIISTAHNSGSNVDCLELVRSIEGADNSVCADCGSMDSVEWISSNILVAVCVQCSSCHRHMGSHVSKIRSLKLDNFSAEGLVLLEYVNNSLVNSYLQDTKETIASDSNDEDRLSFIKQKYIQRAFMEPIADINSLLVQSVRKVDIFGVIKSLNCGADPNLRLQVGSSTHEIEPSIISLFEYSLRKAVKVDATGDSSKDYFVISELLLLHGCNIQNILTLNPAFRFSEEAQEYWERKKLRVS